MPATIKRARVSGSAATSKTVSRPRATQKKSPALPSKSSTSTVKQLSTAPLKRSVQESSSIASKSQKKPAVKDSSITQSAVKKITQSAKSARATTNQRPASSARSQSVVPAARFEVSKTRSTVNNGESRARRVRAPKDLAVQYGENAKTRKDTQTAQPEKRTRRNAAARARLQELMTPDDDLLIRLARAGMIAQTLAPEISEEGAETKNRKSASSVKRKPRNWESRCGKCGGLSIFKSSAGLCPKCGAIVVRE